MKDPVEISNIPTTMARLPIPPGAARTGRGKQPLEDGNCSSHLLEEPVDGMRPGQVIIDPGVNLIW